MSAEGRKRAWPWREGAWPWREGAGLVVGDQGQLRCPAVQRAQIPAAPGTQALPLQAPPRGSALCFPPVFFHPLPESPAGPAAEGVPGAESAAWRGLRVSPPSPLSAAGRAAGRRRSRLLAPHQVGGTSPPVHHHHHHHVPGPPARLQLGPRLRGHGAPGCPGLTARFPHHPSGSASAGLPTCSLSRTTSPREPQCSPTPARAHSPPPGYQGSGCREGGRGGVAP